MTMTRRNAALALATLACGGVGAARAALSDRPIWWVVPYSVGGSADVVSRALTGRLGERMGQRVLVDNKPGAGGSIGSEHVARSAPDGHTILYESLAIAINPALKPMKFDAEKELIPLMQISNMWGILVAPASAPYNTFAEFLEWARKNPGNASFGTSGPGSAGHITGEQLKAATKLDIVHVPYKGGGPGVAAALAGQVSVYFATPGSGMPSIRAGRLKPLATTAPTRHRLLPNTPTYTELGFPDMVANEWSGAFLPRGTPQEVMQVLHKEITGALAEPAVRDVISGLGIDIHTTGPAEFQEFVRNEAQRWGRVIRQLQIKAE